MCGIVGIIAQNGGIPAGLLERSADSLAHRGPDDSGTIVLRRAAGTAEVGLGNRRLAILDLSTEGHQPMHDPATGNWIVYNGELYNFRDIREELLQAGIGFANQSDTEVVLKAYARWGEACLEKFRGMYAFAIWDARRCRLFLARDPMGIKPLYYAHTDSYFLFASEVRTLVKSGLVKSRIDRAGLINYLTFGSAYDPITLVEGIRALPAAHSMVWESGSLRQSKYWDLAGMARASGPELQFNAVTESGAVTELKHALEEVVRSQLVSDVPVGVFLSGGIDSSALVSILSRGGVRPSTFSIVFGESDFSEVQHSRAIAERFGTDHHEITLSPHDTLAALPDVLRAMDQPTMDGVNTYFVARETRRAGVKVALSGLGGDEVFAGYSTFRSVPRMEWLWRFWKHLPRAFRIPLAGAFAALVPANPQNLKISSLMRDEGQIEHPYFLSRMLFMPDQRTSFLRNVDPEFAEIAAASQRDELESSLSLDPVNRISYLESRCYMLNTLLRDADCMSMSQGVEVRVPLIDHRLAKAVLGLPGAWKLDGTPKKLLVQALTASLPDDIVHRPKRGFTLPFEHWLRDELRPEMESVLSAKKVAEGPLGSLFNSDQVENVWRDFLRGKTSWSRPWSFYVLHRWCELNSISA